MRMSIELEDTTRCRSLSSTVSVSAVGIDVRLVKSSEHAAWIDQLGLAFFTHHPAGASDYYQSISEPKRSRGAFDGESVVGTLRSFGTDLTVPGPAMARASALTAVSVAPTHRRRGVLRSMITGDLQDSRDRGEAVSVLIASEYPIYGRFGYGPATEQATYEISTTDLHFQRPCEGSVALVDLATLRKLAVPIFERFRQVQPGSIERSDAWWDRVTRQVEVPGAEPRKGFQAVYRSSSGDLEGFVLYEGKLDWETLPVKGTLTVEELVATTPSAYQALWEFCFGVDLTTTTVAPTRSTDELLPLLVDDARKVRLTARSDLLWVRLLDACAALAARRYFDRGKLILEVRDDLSFAQGRFELESDAEGSTCRKTTETPHLTVPVQALGAAYLGGVSWTRLADAGQVDEHFPGAVAQVDRMFKAPRAPWCTTYF